MCLVIVARWFHQCSSGQDNAFICFNVLSEAQNQHTHTHTLSLFLSRGSWIKEVPEVAEKFLRNFQESSNGKMKWQYFHICLSFTSKSVEFRFVVFYLDVICLSNLKKFLFPTNIADRGWPDWHEFWFRYPKQQVLAVVPPCMRKTTLYWVEWWICHKLVQISTPKVYFSTCWYLLIWFATSVDDFWATIWRCRYDILLNVVASFTFVEKKSKISHSFRP